MIVPAHRPQARPSRGTMTCWPRSTAAPSRRCPRTCWAAGSNIRNRRAVQQGCRQRISCHWGRIYCLHDVPSMRCAACSVANEAYECSGDGRVRARCKPPASAEIASCNAGQAAVRPAGWHQPCSRSTKASAAERLMHLQATGGPSQTAACVERAQSMAWQYPGRPELPVTAYRKPVVRQL